MSCPVCIGPVHLDSKGRLPTYCSRQCGGTAVGWGNALKPKERLRHYRCAACAKEFTSYYDNRKFCSMGCSVAYRRSNPVAGTGKKDANHAALVRVFEQLGCTVLECHNIGIPGFPDLVVGCAGVNRMVEVKNPHTIYGRRGLNANQTAFARDWRGGGVVTVMTVDDVIAAVQRWRQYEATTVDEAIAIVQRHTSQRQP